MPTPTNDSELGELTDEQLTRILEVIAKLGGTSVEPWELSRARDLLARERKRIWIQKHRGLWLRLSSNVPGTRSFRRRYAIDVIQFTKYRSLLFYTLKELDFATKRSLFRRLKKLQHSVAKLDAWTEITKRGVARAIGWIGFAAALTVSLVLVRRWTGYSLVGWRRLLEFLLLYFLTSNLLLLPLKFRIRKKLSSPSSVTLTLAIWPATVISVFAWLTHRMIVSPGAYLQTDWQVALLGAMVSSMVIWLVLVIAIGLLLAFLRLIDYWKRTRHPAEVVVDELVMLLVSLEKKRPPNLSTFETKRVIVGHLERIASSVELVPRALPTGDSSTDAWLKQRMREIAFGVRSLKRWVLTPKVGTDAILRIRLADMLRLSVLGQWDAMPFAVPDSISPTRSRLARLRESLAIALMVAIPIFAASVLGPNGLGAGAISRYAGIAVVFWIVLVAVASLNPEKLRTLKDLLEFLTLTGKKN